MSVEKDFGIIQYYSCNESSKFCGYCKSEREANSSYGLWAVSMDTDTYQHMIDRNWRRCGKYLYRPINDKLCCPLYTIRCNTECFQLKKSHKKLLKRFNNFIKYDLKPKISELKSKSANVDSEVKLLENMDCSTVDIDVIENLTCLEKEDISPIASVSDVKDDQNISVKEIKGDCNVIDKSKMEQPKYDKVNKKKFMRRCKLIEKIKKRENCSDEQAVKILYDKCRSKQITKTLEQFLTEYSNCSEPKHTFKIKLIPVKSLDDNEKRREYGVFKKYQMSIHKEKESEVSFHGFERFLIESSLKYNRIKGNSDSELAMQYGSYHLQYLIDDRLVAVGVIDILLFSISSVYLFYDPEYSFLNLGGYSALNEISLVRQYHKLSPELNYYYMGFYVHQCPKMRYKGNYLPSDLLCSETYRWFPIESCLPKLSQSLYARFCDDNTVMDDDGANIRDGQIFILRNNYIFKYDIYKRMFSRSRELKYIQEFASLVGAKCASKLLYYINDNSC